MFNHLKKNFRNTLFKYATLALNNAIPGGKWHVLNHFIMVVFKKQYYKYNLIINDSYLRGIIAFLVTLYEIDYFSKIMIAVGLPYDEYLQADHFRNYTKYYILRWIPGMLTSRFIMARDFIRATRANSSLVRYNLRYMRTTVLKLYHIPDLLILNRMGGVGSIVAKEAVIMKLPTIGIADSQSFPHKIGFKYYGQAFDFNYIKSFLYLLALSMETGQNLYVHSNFCGYDGKPKISREALLRNSEIMLIKWDDLKDPYVHFKQIKIHNIFKCQIKNKFLFNFKKRFSLKQFIKFYKIILNKKQFIKGRLKKFKINVGHLKKQLKKHKNLILKKITKKKSKIMLVAFLAQKYTIKILQ